MEKNAIQVFQSDDFGNIRTLDEDGKVLFSGSDVARALGYSNDRDALARHCKGVVKRDILSNGGKQETNFIPEGDLFRLITHSKLPVAQRFERWVFDEVLPSIRKYGAYAASGIFENPDTMAALVLALQHEQERTERLQQRLNWMNSPKAQRLRKADLARKPATDDLPERAVLLFVSTIQQLLDGGEARVQPTTEAHADDDGENLIGFIDNDYLYVHPQQTYEAVTKHCREAGSTFPITRKMLNRCLRQMGMVATDPSTGNATKPKYVDGHTVRAYWIPLDKINLGQNGDDAREAENRGDHNGA